MLEQAAAGPCLDAPWESTLARARGAMVGTRDPRAARAVLDPPGKACGARRDLHPKRLADAVEAHPRASRAFARLVRAAHQAARAPEVGKIDASAFAESARGVGEHVGRMLSAAGHARGREARARSVGRRRQAREENRT